MLRAQHSRFLFSNILLKSAQTLSFSERHTTAETSTSFSFDLRRDFLLSCFETPLFRNISIYEKFGLRHVMSLYMLPWCPQSIHILYISHINTSQHQNTNMAMRYFFSNVSVRRARHGPPQHAWGRQFALQCARATIGKRKRRPKAAMSRIVQLQGIP